MELVLLKKTIKFAKNKCGRMPGWSGVWLYFKMEDQGVFD